MGQFITPQCIHHGGQIGQRDGVCRNGIGKIHCRNFDCKIPLAQNMVEHNKGHVLRLLALLFGQRHCKRQHQINAKIRSAGQHPHIGGIQFQPVHTETESFHRFARQTLPERAHGITLSGGGVYQRLHMRKPGHDAVGTEYQRGFIGIALQLQHHIVEVLLQQVIAFFHQGLRALCGQAVFCCLPLLPKCLGAGAAVGMDGGAHGVLLYFG